MWNVCLKAFGVLFPRAVKPQHGVVTKLYCPLALLRATNNALFKGKIRAGMTTLRIHWTEKWIQLPPKPRGHWSGCAHHLFSTGEAFYCSSSRLCFKGPSETMYFPQEQESPKFF